MFYLLYLGKYPWKGSSSLHLYYPSNSTHYFFVKYHLKFSPNCPYEHCLKKHSISCNYSIKYYRQRRILNPVKHLRWSFSEGSQWISPIICSGKIFSHVCLTGFWCIFKKFLWLPKSLIKQKQCELSLGINSMNNSYHKMFYIQENPFWFY